MLNQLMSNTTNKQNKTNTKEPQQNMINKLMSHNKQTNKTQKQKNLNRTC